MCYSVLEYVCIAVCYTENISTLCQSKVERDKEADAKVLQCVAVCCSVLQCVAVSCSVSQCVAVCCSVLQCVYTAVRYTGNISTLCQSKVERDKEADAKVTV